MSGGLREEREERVQRGTEGGEWGSERRERERVIRKEESGRDRGESGDRE